MNQSIECFAITSLDDLDIVQSYWERVQTHPNTDLAQFKLVCQVRPNVLGPYVVALGSLERPVGLLVARLDRSAFSPTIGYFSPVRIPATVLTVLYQGLLGDLEPPQLMALVHHLWQVLRTGRADAIEFHHLNEDSALLKAFLACAPRLWSQKKTLWSEHWTLNIPQGEGEFNSRMRPKHRKWLRKKERDLDEEFPGSVCWRWIRSFDDIPQLCTRLERVAARTYQRGLGAGFEDNEEHRRRLALFAERDQLRVQLLEIGGDIRAFWFGQVYHGVFHSWATGYDPDLRQHEPGNLLFHRMVSELAGEGVERFDFGLGDALYKQRFGDQSWTEGTVRLFAPSAKGAFLMSALGISSTLDGVGRRLLKAAGFTDRLKTAWRRHIARPRDTPA